MSDLETKAVEVIDKAEQAVETLVLKMDELATQYGPDVLDATLEVARITALGDLLPGITLGLLCPIIYFVGRKFQGLWFSTRDESRALQDADKRWIPVDNRADTYMVCAIISAAAGSVIALSAVICLSNIWAWVGVFNPQLYIAHRVLEGVL